eukprot:CAMPEP_0117016734 /NCGR_PEP_ID=MMETSP0472-20121206/13164_1 /TAXON_ID=693140 ORGANISM="Tiarina fusus, Strain LIS" /NCGR_SAMPLE_ID=MMETSP0472 /ASSEMBLY_ACC=CAM_ASM_000603 /LENGTH=179 /DNA_ID=CAMNT_0004720899 /DNA_START=946 /DNA_END=1485 /DNA_ORIENTATION=-
MVYQQEQFGLDFSSTETWLIFGVIPDEGPIPNTHDAIPAYYKLPTLNDNMPFPHGSVSWRFGNPVDFQTGVGKSVSLLEVMFIAVWEADRGHRLGSKLVEELELEAKKKSVPLMYVEIGFHQPKAKEFWGKNGFKPAKITQDPNLREDEMFCYMTMAQSLLCDAVCLRFADTEQYIKWI